MKNLLFALGAIALLGTTIHLMSNNSMEQADNSIPNDVQIAFSSYVDQYNKDYSSQEEYQYRLQVFYNNWVQINYENSIQDQYQLGITQFSDLTTDEFVATYLGAIPELDNDDDTVFIDSPYEVSTSVNWVTKGAVTPVKNQGSCGSCWSFSATGVCEGADKIYKGTLQSFSEQQLVDCSGSYGNQGCNGGWPYNALQYVAKVGIETESQYPYTGVQGSCKATGGAFKVNSPQKGYGCSQLVSSINRQPTSVCVDASNWSNYRSGVFSNCAKSINHAVLAVGYDDSGNWLIKNSWGTSWGQSGYITLATGDTCGVCEYPVWATA